MQNCLNDFRMTLGGKSYAPLMLGGMGVNISNDNLVLAVEKLGGMAHLSDALLMDVSDRQFGTNYSAQKTRCYKSLIGNPDKSDMKFDLAHVEQATKRYIEDVMSRASGNGLVLLNCMEKLTMNDSLATLKTRLNAALDAGIGGITLSAGLHLSSFKLMADNKRFHDAMLGTIVSSSRALNLFLRKAAAVGRMPDYIVVEGPLAGGHLGFGPDWAEHKLENIVTDVKNFLAEKNLDIPVVAAGGIFTGGDAVRFVRDIGAAGVQVATRFTIAKECAIPDPVKQIYLNANPEDVEVNMFSPTGYPMRMLKSSPAITSEIRPACETYGYILNHGECSYVKEWYARQGDASLPHGKCCICSHMRNYKLWTCGTTVSRLKETTVRLPDGTWHLPSAEDIFNDYMFSTGDDVRVSKPE
ncbi:MAG: nitronate monooxygenase [Duodenibacillus sp.]|nr:nitronate monooxygenase [Duodenibacillus sp.]